MNPSRKLKYPHIYKCSLCDRKYAVLNSTFHISNSYRLKYCADCTQLMLTAHRRIKLALKPWSVEVKEGEA